MVTIAEEYCGGAGRIYDAQKGNILEEEKTCYEEDSNRYHEEWTDD